MKKYISLLAIAGITASLMVAFPVFAKTDSGYGAGRMFKPGVSGTVLSVTGNTITIKNSKTNTTYTADASGATVTKNGASSTVSNIAVGDNVSVQGTITGTNVIATAIRDGNMGLGKGDNKNKGVVGTVASISGTTLTVTSKAKPDGGTAITYTINASGATVTKNGASSTVSNIAVGDTVMIQGTITGTNVVATTIRDGIGQQEQPDIQGNGQPIVAGKITAITGNTITITNNSNITYIIDAASAKFIVLGVAAPTISNVAVGDNVVVQGTVNGTSVIASSVIDQKPKPNNNPDENGNQNNQGNHGGFFEGIGNFFKHLFGF